MAKFVVKPFTLASSGKFMKFVKIFSKCCSSAEIHFRNRDIWSAIKINFLKEKMSVLSSKSLKKKVLSVKLSPIAMANVHSRTFNGSVVNASLRW